MGTRSESANFIVALTLMTDDGELPSDENVEQLVSDQMAGELDEVTGLFCGAVTFLRREDV